MELLKEQKKLQRQDEIARIAVEGKFGQGKRRFSLTRVMTKLAQTSEVSIMISFIVMNMEKIISGILFFAFCVEVAVGNAATLRYETRKSGADSAQGSSLMILFAEQIPRWWMASIVVFGLPILDTATALVRRLINKRPLFVSDRSHIYL